MTLYFIGIQFKVSLIVSQQSTRSRRSAEGGDVEKVEKKKRRRKHRNRKKSNKEVSSDVTVLSETGDNDVTIQHRSSYVIQMLI